MGLISRVSSRTYRTSQIKQPPLPDHAKMSDDECWDKDDAPTKQDWEDDSVDDDWDVDSEEEAEKKAAAKAARLAELNRTKTEAEKQLAQEKAAQDIIDDQLGDLDIDDFDDVATDTTLIREVIAIQNASKPKAPVDESKHPLISTQKISTDPEARKFADLVVNRLYDFKDSKHFNLLLENVARKMAERQKFENFESVKSMGKSLQAIGNTKHTEWKNSTSKKKKGKKNVGISLGGGGKGGATGMENLDEFDDFDGGDDFM